MVTINVVIVSTSALTRGGLQQIIAQSNTPIEVTGSFEHFADASTFLNGKSARVLITDESLKSGSLTKEVKRMMEQHPGLVIILVVQHPTISLTQMMLRIGVRAILHKDDDLDNSLNQAIQIAVTGGTTTSPRISQIVDELASLPKGVVQRDMDILKMLTEGLQPKQIAVHLAVDRSLIYRTVRKLIRVYGAQNLPQLIVLAQRDNLPPPKKKE